MSRLELMPEGPLARIDRALSLVRHGPPEAIARAFFAGALPAFAVLGAFWLERVEGIFELRLGIAATLVLSFCVRSVLLADVARGYVRGLWDAVEIPDDAGRPMAIARTASWVSVGLSLWAVLLLAASILGPFAVGLVFPLLALRGLNAPGWLARVACTPDGGLRALRNAFADNGQQRGENVTVEFLVTLATLGVTINLLATAAFALLLVRSLLGIDLALLDLFLSTRNTFTMLAAGLTALVLLEPMRAALSAIVFVDARVRSEGLDVRAAIDAAIEHASKRRQGRTTAALVLLFTLLNASDTHAQATTDDLASDAEVQAHADRILSAPEYREFDDGRGRGLREFLDRWLSDALHDDTEIAAGDGPVNALPLPGPGTFIFFGALFAVAVALYLLVSRRAPPAEAPTRSAVAKKAEDPRDHAPEVWVDAAAKLAGEGRYREALRALYLATLVALDRRQVITFDPTLTNWQYLRAMSGGELRADFRALTQVFDHKWYGREETTERDYQTCRELAERMVARTERDALASMGRGAST